MTESTALLKQQPEQKNTNWVSLERLGTVLVLAMPR